MTNSTVPTALKPCPFCGSVRLEAVHNSHYDDFTIVCRTCGVEGPTTPRLKWTQDAWNNREGEKADGNK